MQGDRACAQRREQVGVEGKANKQRPMNNKQHRKQVSGCGESANKQVSKLNTLSPRMSARSSSKEGKWKLCAVIRSP
eukprot:1150312-Pelagomonas_calceolata.AAC.6